MNVRKERLRAPVTHRPIVAEALVMSERLPRDVLYQIQVPLTDLRPVYSKLKRSRILLQSIAINRRASRLRRQVVLPYKQTVFLMNFVSRSTWALTIAIF